MLGAYAVRLREKCRCDLGLVYHEKALKTMETKILCAKKKREDVGKDCEHI